MKKFLLSISVFCAASFGFSQAPCSDLFISEYVEGSSQNKAIEIYNPTSNPVNLSNYKIYRYLNGGTTVNDTLFLAGTLNSGDTYHIVNPDTVSPPNSALLSIADTLHTVTFFNGDDALALFNGTTMIDIVGNIGGPDPGTEWNVDTGSTKENTLVRKPDVFVGTTSWTTGVNQWLVYGQNDFSHFGSHTMAPCSTASINDEIIANISMYPNPTTGVLHITSEATGYDLQVLDLTGKTVVNKVGLSNNQAIDLTDYNNGIYLVKLSWNGSLITKKIIVRK